MICQLISNANSAIRIAEHSVEYESKRLGVNSQISFTLTFSYLELKPSGLNGQNSS